MMLSAPNERRVPSSTTMRRSVRTSARLCALAVAALLLAGCGDDEAARRAEQAAAAAKRAETEAEATRAAADFDRAVADGNWPLAKAQADVLFNAHPDSAAAKRVRERYDEVKAKAEAARESARMAALWAYDTEAVAGGEQLSASIYAKENVNIDGSGPTPVRLIFRDHPSWGRSAYLVLQAGDFDCYGGCTVSVSVDDKPAKKLPGTRPKTDEAIAMFIEDEAGLWRMTRGAKAMRIEFPVKGQDKQGKRSAVFEVGGLDHARLPKWK